MDLQDPKSASVSALTKRNYNRELAEGELASCPRGLPARKRQRAGKNVRFSLKKVYGLSSQFAEILQ